MTTQTTTTPAVSPLMEIALRIREMRRITGFTEKEMAEKTGVTEAEYRPARSICRSPSCTSVRWPSASS